MSFETLAGKGISSTYNRLVQTDGVYLADGTGSLINNLTVPGNLVVSGTLYAQNTVVVTQSFSSGSNILGDAVNDFQTLYGTVRIPTGSLTVTGSITSTETIVSTAVYPNNIGFATSGSAASSVGFHANTWAGTYTGVSAGFVANTYTGSATNYGLVVTRPNNPNFGQFQLFVKTDNITVLNLGGGGPILDIANNGTSYARFDGSNFSIGATSALSKVYISGSSSQALLRIDSPATSSIIYVSGSGVIGFNETSSLGAQATFRGVVGSTNFTEINTFTNGGYGLRTNGSAKADGYYFYNAAGGNILTAGGVSMMAFDSSRNVGIAVSSSIGARLHVRGSGTTSATTAFRVENANASASLVVLDDRQTRIQSEGAALFVEGAGVSPFSQNIAEFRYAGNGNSLIISQQNGSAGLTTSTNTDLNINPNGTGTTVFLQGKQVRFFNSSNNSNIALQNNGATGQARLDFITGSTTVMSITASGNVGIGTTTPAYTLDVIGNARIGANSNSSTNVTVEVTAGGGGNNALIDYGYFSTFDASLWRAGYFGTDGGKFKIQSTVTGNAFDVFVLNGTSTFSFLTGSVGIGITTPTAKLHVSGSPGTGSAVAIYKSGSNVLSIDGSSGRLFSVDDSLSGSLFSVNTAAGLPTIEAFSDNTVNIGKYNVYPIKVVSNGTAAAITGSFSGSIRATSITLTGSLNVSGSQNYVGDVNILGTLTATVKSFLIEHPTQPGKKLQYGNLEGPEHAVYFRGRSTSSIIEFPEEWAGLVNEETVTVQLTPVGGYQPLYVSTVTSTRVEIQVAQPMALNYHYLIHGERKDIDKLITTVN